MLRKWQKQCADTALSKYGSGASHFLCLASPGSGKTLMAAEVARRMLSQGMIDLIICFAPSSEVVSSIEGTFSGVLKSNFTGGLGAVGGAYTYHNLIHFDKGFWNTLARHRFLVIFDEIHHCSGDSQGNANIWGSEILANIKHSARYTLALTGTPWRTDNLPIVLSDYASTNGKICCDYIYGMYDAIVDEVCRKPKIVLINSDDLVYSSNESTRHFGSISEFLCENLVSYRSFLWHTEAIRYVIKAGCEKLHELRKENPAAGGLIVASSVEHAFQLLNILENEFSQTATMVTYHDKQALSKIDDFRNGTTEWIVSVGMISEGTDIPRLQVCCHLSTVKTELYFRQVLGRIVRVNRFKNQEAWLFTIATQELTLFAERLAEELPEEYRIVQNENALSEIAEQINISESDVRKKEFSFINTEKSYSGINLDLNGIGSKNASFDKPDMQLTINSLHQRVINVFLTAEN